jgi:hypothetical protein
MNEKQKRKQSHFAGVRERAATRPSRRKLQPERYNKVMLERRERALRPAGAAPEARKINPGGVNVGAALDQIIKRQESGGYSKTRSK